MDMDRWMNLRSIGDQCQLANSIAFAIGGGEGIIVEEGKEGTGICIERIGSFNYVLF